MFTFFESNTCNLRSDMNINQVNMHSTQYGTESRGKNWNLVPAHMKDLKALTTFDNQIKEWIPKECPCRLSKV